MRMQFNRGQAPSPSNEQTLKIDKRIWDYVDKNNRMPKTLIIPGMGVFSCETHEHFVDQGEYAETTLESIIIPMTYKWLLDEAGEPITYTGSLKDWASFYMDSDKRIVKQEIVHNSKISTVFLAFDHQFGKGPPILWETMVFGGKLDGEQNRCGGPRQNAINMHNQMVRDVMRARPWWRKAIDLIK